MGAKLMGCNISDDVAANPAGPAWTVAIFTARETVATLAECMLAAVRACEGKVAVVDVLVNGNRQLADAAASAVAGMAADPGGAAVRVWFIPFGDKAHAWNEYIHRIWQASDITYCIDGYAVVRPDAFALIAAGLAADPEPIAASGVPTSGRSSAGLRNAMLQEGGIHGNLHAIRGTAIAAMRASFFRLPIGLYRTDSLIGAMMMFRLDPAAHRWNAKRILVHPDATWSVGDPEPWTPNNLLVQFKRRLRQAQGHLENRAVREHLAVRRLSPASMPRTINEMVNSWIQGQPGQAWAVFLRNPLSLYAAFKLRQGRDWSAADTPPLLIHGAPPQAGLKRI